MALAPLDDREIRDTRYHVLSDGFPQYPPLPQMWGSRDATDLRVRRLLYAYDLISLYVLEDLIDEEYVIELHRDSMFIVWKKLEWFLPAASR